MIAPDLIVPEVCNVAWHKAVEKQITVEMAIELRHPVYDCFYLSLTEAIEGQLVTADKQFLKVVGRAGFDRKKIRLIGEGSLW